MVRKAKNKDKSLESTGPKRVALYARVSTHEQATEGVSIEAQIDRLDSWAKSKGCIIVDKYIDPGYSGKDDKRPEFQRLMIDAHRGKFDIVAVAMLDRFMRNLRLLLNRLHELEGLGITFESVRESLDTATPNGKFSIQIMGVIAEFERERIGERVSDSRNHLKKMGKWSAGRPKYGYRWNKEASKFEIVEDEAEVIRHAFDLYVNQAMGIVRVAQRLTEEGYRTRPKRRNGNEEPTIGYWQSSVVHNLLSYPGYAGEDEDYPFPAIIPKELFTSAQKKLATSRRIRQETGGWLLQGRVVCGLCGHRVSPRKRSGRHRRRYGCTGYDKHLHPDGSPRCTLASIPADELEKMVWGVFARTITNKQLLRQSVEDALAKLESRQKELGYDKVIDAKLKEIDGKLSRLMELYIEDDTFNRTRLDEKKQELVQEKMKLERRKDSLNPEARLDITKLEDYIKTVRAILDDGHIRVDHNGLLLGTLWHHAKGGGLMPEEYDLFDLWEGKEPDLDDESAEVTTVNTIGPDGEEVRMMEIKPSEKEWADFERRDEISMEQKRKLLEKFDIKIVAYPDRIEIAGLLPTQTLEWDSISNPKG
ncbi:MAG: recombinase family protein [Dehalococcoidia bacterium]|nr:recombinase family protein [Dehalococcoidia bacterium]